MVLIICCASHLVTEAPDGSVIIGRTHVTVSALPSSPVARPLSMTPRRHTKDAGFDPN